MILVPAPEAERRRVTVPKRTVSVGVVQCLQAQEEEKVEENTGCDDLAERHNCLEEKVDFIRYAATPFHGKEETSQVKGSSIETPPSDVCVSGVSGVECQCCWHW